MACVNFFQSDEVNVIVVAVHVQRQRLEAELERRSRAGRSSVSYTNQPPVQWTQNQPTATKSDESEKGSKAVGNLLHRVGDFVKMGGAGILTAGVIAANELGIVQPGTLAEAPPLEKSTASPATSQTMATEPSGQMDSQQRQDVLRELDEQAGKREEGVSRLNDVREMFEKSENIEDQIDIVKPVTTSQEDNPPPPTPASYTNKSQRKARGVQ